MFVGSWGSIFSRKVKEVKIKFRQGYIRSGKVIQGQVSLSKVREGYTGIGKVKKKKPY